MKKLLGFTLTELMIAITVLGILTAAVLPAVLGNNPNQNKIMMKKAYYTTAEVISEMINNESLFPTWGWNDQEYRAINFEEEVVGGPNIGVLNNGDPVDFDGINTGTDGQGIPKATLIFSRMINPKVNPITSKSEEGLKYQGHCAKIVENDLHPCYITKTKDGMIWCFSGTPNDTMGLFILVDVNGDAKPNCIQGMGGYHCDPNRTENFDQFRMHVYADGAIIIDDKDIWAKDAITVGSSLSN